MKILVLGLGQSLRGDDAAGLIAVQAWQKKYPHSAEQILVETCELPGLALLDLLEGMEFAILVDAVETTMPPGSILKVEPQDLAAFTSDAQSAHGWGIAESLNLARSLNLPQAGTKITLIAIAGGDFTIGAGLSQPVSLALDTAVETIEREICAAKR